MADMRVRTVGTSDSWEALQGALGAAAVRSDSIVVDAGGASQKVVIGAVSAQSTALTNSRALVTTTADCFVRQGTNPTALADGTDIFLSAGVYRLSGITSGNKLAFITSAGVGDVFITPGG